MHDRAPIEQVTASFWTLVGCTPNYPCDLEAIILWSQPTDFHLTCDSIPKLDVNAVNARAQRLDIQYRFTGPNRRLRGCLLADRGSGCILFDANDPKDEQRFTIAHELAHFLADYYLPRTRALQLIGETIRPVLDGLRQPNLTERTHAAIMNVHLGVLGRLMERPDEGLPESTVLMVEDRADRIALEIMAPADALLIRLAQLVRQPGAPTQVDWLISVLKDEYGLPSTIASAYARELVRRRGGSTLLDWIVDKSR
jgi:hypothetical protein